MSRVCFNMSARQSFGDILIST